MSKTSRQAQCGRNLSQSCYVKSSFAKLPRLSSQRVYSGKFFLKSGVGHVDFTPEEFLQIVEDAADLFFEEVISP